MSAEDRVLLAHPDAREVWTWLSRQIWDRQLTLDSQLEADLGVDSLDWLHLALEMQERARTELTDDIVARVDTVRDLLREVAEASAGQKPNAGTSFLDEPETYLSSHQTRWLQPLGTREARLATLLHGINRKILRGLFRLHVEGLHRIPRGQAVFTPTHGSYLDAFLVAAALDRRRLAQAFWAADADIAFGNFLNRWVSRHGQAVPFDAAHGFIAGMALAAAVLKRGYSLIWFPERRRSRSTKLQKFKPGIGVLLKHYPVPVVPVAIRGAHEAFPPGRMLPRLRSIAIAFGEPLDPVDLERQGQGSDGEHRIANALQRHTAKLYRRTRSAA
jgi:long-chain acyl-CoA synthetase